MTNFRWHDELRKIAWASVFRFPFETAAYMYVCMYVYRKRKVCFPWSANDKQLSTIAVSANVPIYKVDADLVLISLISSSQVTKSIRSGTGITDLRDLEHVST
jgi:hypothetical protein